MSTDTSAPVRFVSVKFSPIGRPQTFLLNDLLFADSPPTAGDKVVVQSDAGSAVGAVVPTPSTLMDRRQPPEHSPNRVVRKATAEDVMVRLKRQQREQEAHRVALLKIRERGLEMKLTRVEQLFDGSRLISTRASRCGRSARATKRRCWVATAPAAGRCAARPG
jgi:cell fate regulator YaaT (PSP1 superfamily)